MEHQRQEIDNYTKTGIPHAKPILPDEETEKQQEQPLLEYLSELIISRLDTSLDLSNEMTFRLHKLQDTNVPQNSNDVEKPINNLDIVSKIQTALRKLDVLNDKLYNVNQKLKNLI